MIVSHYMISPKLLNSTGPRVAALPLNAGNPGELTLRPWTFQVFFFKVKTRGIVSGMLLLKKRCDNISVGTIRNPQAEPKNAGPTGFRATTATQGHACIP